MVFFPCETEILVDLRSDVNLSFEKGVLLNEGAHSLLHGFVVVW